MRKRNHEPYWGSVRFFRHLILTALALLIIIPICTSIHISLRFRSLSSEYQNQRQTVENQALQIDDMQSRLLRNAGNAASPYADTQTGPTDTASAINSKNWNLILVNNQHALPSDFVVNLVKFGEDQYIDSRSEPELKEMMDAAARDGLPLYICSSYRSLEKQQGLFYQSMKDLTDFGYSYDEAFYLTRFKIALPSESDHHTGLTVDIIRSGAMSVQDAAPGSPEMDWLLEHCADYGFILRYPDNKSKVTGVGYLPYCYRYVGKDAARTIMSSHITLEEYLGVAD